MSLSVSRHQRPTAAAPGSILFHITFSFSLVRLSFTLLFYFLYSLVTVWSSYLFFRLNLLPLPFLFSSLPCCPVCCVLHVRRPPEAWLLVRRMNKCGTPPSSSPSSHQSPFSLSHLPLLVFTPLFPISLSMYLSLTLSACRLWEWCVMLGEWG